MLTLYCLLHFDLTEPDPLVKNRVGAKASPKHTKSDRDMDAKDALVAEYLAAQAERERALAAVEQAHHALEDARGEYAVVQSSQADSEQQMQRAAEQLSAGLSALHVDEQKLVVDDFLVEYHANVGCYNCYLVVRPPGEGVADVEVEMLSVRVEFPVVELVQRVPLSSKDDEELVVVWQTTIDRDVEVDQCSVDRKLDHIYVRLPLKESAKQPLGGLSSFSRVAPEELEPASYASARCRSCESQLLQPQDAAAHRFDKVLPLPSTNWMEMFDFWGSGIGAFEHIPRDGILAHRRRIFVGEADIMMHREDLSPSAITCVPVFKAVSGTSQEGEEDTQEEQWQTVFCGKCRAVIGLASAENPDTIRFHKHMIAASSLQASASPDIFSRYTIDSILSAKLLELADSDGIFRYRLAPLRDSASFMAPPSVFGPIPPPPPPYQLQLLSWETMVQDQHSPAFRRVLKVLFAPVTDENEASGSKKADHHHHDHSHLPPLPMHEVALSPETLRIIVKRLDKSSRMLPPSLQTFTEKRVGYLFA